MGQYSKCQETDSLLCIPELTKNFPPEAWIDIDGLKHANHAGMSYEKQEILRKIPCASGLKVFTMAIDLIQIQQILYFDDWGIVAIIYLLQL